MALFFSSYTFFFIMLSYILIILDSNILLMLSNVLLTLEILISGQWVRQVGKGKTVSHLSECTSSVLTSRPIQGPHCVSLMAILFIISSNKYIDEIPTFSFFSFLF